MSDNIFLKIINKEIPANILYEDEKVCNMFDVIKEKSLYGRKYMGIDRSTFLIGTDLKIIDLWRNVKVKGHVDEVITKIKELK